MTNLDVALEYFQQALSLDPTYAPAHAGIALVYWTQPPGGRARASAAIHQALALDSTLAEVQYAAALVRTWHEWDWDGGEAAFRKAIEINPNYADARAFYAAFLYTMERPEEGREQMDRALELDPFNLVSRAMNGRILCYHHHQYAEAIEQLEAVLRMEPSHLVAKRNLIEAYHLNGNYDEALALIRNKHSEDQGIPEALDRGYAEGGYRAALLRYAEALVARWENGMDHLDIVRAYAMAGEKERTLEWLELAYQVKNINLPAHVPATGGGLLPYDDPRYQDLRRRMNLPTGPEGN
jgi:Tfp pilus assembly protein PilF